MISDPKLPFANEPPGFQNPAEGSSQPPHENASPSEPVNSITRQPVSIGRLWLRRIGVLLFVFLCATLGVMLMIVPWRPEWSDNPLLFPYPTLREMIASGFTRGLVTGLGLLNVWIGFWEAMQYRED